MNEFVSAEIEYIKVQGRHQVGPTTCLPCLIGQPVEGHSRCEPCTRNQYYSIKGHKCENCPSGKFSPPHSLGLASCKHKRPCDMADLEYSYSGCTHGKRFETARWGDHYDNNEIACSDKMTKPANLKPYKRVV